MSSAIFMVETAYLNFSMIVDWIYRNFGISSIRIIDGTGLLWSENKKKIELGVNPIFSKLLVSKNEVLLQGVENEFLGSPLPFYILKRENWAKWVKLF